MAKPEFLIGEVASLYPDLYHPDSELAEVMREREQVANMPHWPGESRFVAFETMLEQAVSWAASRMSEIEFSDRDVRSSLRSESEILSTAALRSSATSADLLSEFVSEGGGSFFDLEGEVTEVLHNPNLNEAILRDLALACVRSERIEELERATRHSNWNADHNEAVRAAIEEQGMSPGWEVQFMSLVPRD